MAAARAGGAAAAAVLVRVTHTKRPAKGAFCPALPVTAACAAQRLAEQQQARGLALRGRVLGFTTPAVRDVGGASLCLRLEEQDAGTVGLQQGGYLLALKPIGGAGFLPAIAGVPCREGLDRFGASRLGLAECMVLARPLAEPSGAPGHLTFLHEPVLRGWIAEGSVVEVVLLARLTDFFLGLSGEISGDGSACLNAGTWLRVRIRPEGLRGLAEEIFHSVCFLLGTLWSSLDAEQRMDNWLRGDIAAAAARHSGVVDAREGTLSMRQPPHLAESAVMSSVRFACSAELARGRRGMSQKVMLSEQEAPPEPPEKPPMCEVVQVVAIVTQVFAIGLFLYGGYAYNAVFLSRILKAAGRDHLVTPFAIAFNTFYILGLLSYIAGAITDPGSVPKRWLTFVNQYDQYLPVAYPRQEWQPGKATRCKKCNIVRPERAHHCHFCHKCILRMDHHCPWMNNCVGMFNHKYFVLLGIYAGLASLIALVTTMPDMFQCISSVIRMDPTVNYGSVFSRHQGYISAGGHVLDATMTVEEAKLKCASLPNCEGFCFKGTEAEGLPLNVYFKDKWNLWSDGSSDWTAYRYQKAD
ncbi:unnamed protein product [Effrenium voratum]|nr:unnamed protein product [Effrenium voratum]